MRKSFSVNDILNSQSRAPEQKTRGFTLVDVPLEKLIPSAANLYGIREVEELAANIESMGLMHNLLVRRKGEGYEIISGERRYRACKLLFDGGNMAFATIPCKVEEEGSDTLTELKLIYANATARVLTDSEKVEQAKRLKELFQKLRAEGYEIKGRLREIVAQVLDVSPAQVSRMESIGEKLIPELTEEFRAGNIGFVSAYDASTLPPEQQREVMEDYKHDGAEAIKKAKRTASSKASPEDTQRRQEPASMPKRTNADTIRIMTLDELAHFLSEWKAFGNGGEIKV